MVLWFKFDPYPFGCGCQNRFEISFWLVGEFTTHFRTYFSGDWDVHWGYDLDFDPLPFQPETRWWTSFR